MLYSDQLSEFEIAGEKMLEEITSRENDCGKSNVSQHIGRGIIMSMSKDYANVSIRNWFPKDKAAVLGKLTYKNDMGEEKMKQVLHVGNEPVVAGCPGIEINFSEFRAVLRKLREFRQHHDLIGDTLCYHGAEGEVESCEKCTPFKKVEYAEEVLVDLPKPKRLRLSEDVKPVTEEAVRRLKLKIEPEPQPTPISPASPQSVPQTPDTEPEEAVYVIDSE